METFIAELVNNIFSADTMYKIMDAMKFNAATSDVSGTMADISNAVIPIASVILVMHLLLSLIDKVSSDNFNTDQFIKLLLKFAVGSIFINNAYSWSLSIMNFGNAFIDTVGSSLHYYTVNTNDIAEAIKEWGFWTKVFSVPLLLIPSLVNFAIGIAAIVVCWSRNLEMTIRAAFAPIGCADILTGGAHSSGFKYLKSMLAISLQGGLMLAIFAMTNMFLKDSFNGGLDEIRNLGFYAKYFGLQGAMLALMGGAKGLAKEIIGV